MYFRKTDKNEGKEFEKRETGNKQLPKFSEGTRDKITPYFYGEKLSLDQDLVADGFPAITNKVIATVSPQGIIELKHEDGSNQSNYLIRRRNSFFDLHNPDLSRLDCRPKPSFEESEEFFKNYIIAFGLLHTSSFMFPFEAGSNDIKVITQEREEVFRDEDIPQIIVGRRTVQVSDDDIDSTYIPHRSPADFCVTVGSLARKDADSKVRWAESVKKEEPDTSEDIKIIDEHGKKVRDAIKSSAGADAVTSIHSIGSYKETGDDKDSVFGITELKKVKSTSFKNLSFGSVHTATSNETVTLRGDD